MTSTNSPYNKRFNYKGEVSQKMFFQSIKKMADLR